MQLPKLLRIQKGFTLIELVVVIGVLAVLLAIVLVAINPQRQFQQANDTQRRSDVNALLNAITQNAADARGVLPDSISATGNICKQGGTVDATDCPAGGYDLCDNLVTNYIADLPIDPTLGEKDPVTGLCTAATGYNTGYTASAAANRVTVCSPVLQLGGSFCVTR